MHYDLIHNYYPWINELFAIVSDLIHSKHPPHEAIRHLRRDYMLQLDRIADFHLPHVLDKLLEWAQVLYCNLYEDEPVELPDHPEPCPYCSSIDKKVDICWCRPDQTIGGNAMVNKAIEKLRKQSQGYSLESLESWIAESLIDQCRKSPVIASILASTEKNIQDCAKVIKEYVRKNRISGMTPATTKKLITQFYGIAGSDVSRSGDPASITPPEPAPIPAPTQSTAPPPAIDILDFL